VVMEVEHPPADRHAPQGRRRFHLKVVVVILEFAVVDSAGEIRLVQNPLLGAYLPTEFEDKKQRLPPDPLGGVLHPGEAAADVPQEGSVGRTRRAEFAQAATLAEVGQYVHGAATLARTQGTGGGEGAHGVVVALRQLQAQRRKFDVFPGELALRSLFLLALR